METWREAHKKGMEYLDRCAKDAVDTLQELCGDIPRAEAVIYVASEIANDVYPDSRKNADGMFARMALALMPMKKTPSEGAKA